MILVFHTHTFPDAVAGRIIGQLAASAQAVYYTNATRAALFESMKNAGIDYALNLPVATRPDQVAKLNRSLLADREQMLEKHYLTFGSMHPDFEDYREELRFLKEHGIPGIKLHPASQAAELDDPRMMRIIDAASELDMAVIIHAGFVPMVSEHNFAGVPMIEKVIREIRPPKFVLAHLGNWNNWKEVEKELCGAPVYMDTALVFNRIFVRRNPDGINEYSTPLSDEDFLRIIRRHGTGRILFGTDSPWADQRVCADRIRGMALTETERNQIFWSNAAALLGLKA